MSSYDNLELYHISEASLADGVDPHWGPARDFLYVCSLDQPFFGDELRGAFANRRLSMGREPIDIQERRGLMLQQYIVSSMVAREEVGSFWYAGAIADLEPSNSKLVRTHRRSVMRGERRRTAEERSMRKTFNKLFREVPFFVFMFPPQSEEQEFEL
jgi:hypothetical protein